MRYKPLKDEQVELMMKVHLSELENKARFDEFYQNYFLKADFLAQVLEKRIKVFKLPRFEPSAIIFISLLVDGNPGRAVLALIETLEKAEELSGGGLIDSAFIANSVYPWGFYTDEEFEKEFERRKEEHNRLI